MIGAILLIIGILLYFNPKYRYLSYFLYLSFMMKGFNLWTDAITGIKTMDMAVIYTFVISVYLVATNRWKIPRWPIRKFYIALIIVVGVCVVFSYFYYGLTPYQILQGGRNYLLVFSLPVLLRVKSQELRKVLNLLLLFCVLTSALYILQSVLRTPLMPYGEVGYDPATGLPRFYNTPFNLVFFLTLSFIAPQFFKGNIWIYRILFIMAVIATLGRTFMVSAVCSVMLALLLQGKMKRIGTAIAFIFVIITPFYGVLNDRFEGGGGTSDFEEIVKGGYKDYQGGADGGTMVYRFAWVYERLYYMEKRPISEFLLGLGLVSDSQPWVYNHYSFTIGLPSEEFGLPTQLSTPDISYGNLLVKIGVLGTIIYIAFFLSLTIFLYKKKKTDILILISVSTMIAYFLTSFSGSSFSEVRNFALVFMMLSIIYHQRKKEVTPTD